MIRWENDQGCLYHSFCEVIDIEFQKIMKIDSILQSIFLFLLDRTREKKTFKYSPINCPFIWVKYEYENQWSLILDRISETIF